MVHGWSEVVQRQESRECCAGVMSENTERQHTAALQGSQALGGLFLLAETEKDPQTKRAKKQKFITARTTLKNSLWKSVG